jgi:hypothetical protein
MDWQTVFVLVCVLAATGYLVRAMTRARLKKCDRGCGCSAAPEVRTDRVNLA